MQKYVQSGQPERQVQAEFLKFSGSYPPNTQNNWAGRLKIHGKYFLPNKATKHLHTLPRCKSGPLHVGGICGK